MKKLLAVLALASVTMGSMAQDAATTEKYSVATNSFWSNWFVQANVAGSAFWGNQEEGNGFSKSPLKGFRNNLGFSVAVGKWFTPGLGLRTKFSGVWGRTVVDEHKHKNNYWTLNEHILFNLSNMFCGYNETRVWNAIPFFGGGINRNCSYDRYNMNLAAGFLNTFRLSKHFGLYLELGWTYAESDFDGVEAGGTSQKSLWEGKDNKFYAEVGMQFNLGKSTWSKTPDVDAIKALSQSQIEALNAELNDAKAENTRLKSLLAAKKDEPVGKNDVKTYTNTPLSVFFNINKATIASRKDLVNVEKLAEFAKDNKANLVVTGYADSATGSAAYNKKLSERRAETVANELVKMGVSRDQITTEGMGGVKELSPVSYNRRATVKIAD